MIPAGTHWRGPNWICLKKGQWYKRCLYWFLFKNGLVARCASLEKFGHGHRVYRFVSDTGHLHADNV
jgi:hypothetical protein